VFIILGVYFIIDSFRKLLDKHSILNKQSRTTDKGCSSSLGVGFLYRNKVASYETLHSASYLDGFYASG